MIHSSYCENTIVFCFWTKANYSRSSYHNKEIWNQAKFLCLILTACKISNESNKRLLRYCTLIFSMSCRIASVTSCLSKNEAKNLQNGDIHLAQFPDFEMGYLENHLAYWSQLWLIFFFIFHALSIELNFFRPEVLFNIFYQLAIELFDFYLLKGTIWCYQNKMSIFLE